VNKNALLLLSVSYLSLFLLSACGGATVELPPDDLFAGAPDWVTGDCRAHFGQKQVICGVGSVSGEASPSLARKAAIGRGRTEVARYLQVRVKSILADNQSTGGDIGELSIEESSKQIADITLSGTRMVEHWIAADQTYYALMSLGIDDFTGSVQQAQGIDEGVRYAVLQNTDKAFAVYKDETLR
jgi:hypothetical protein